jgi:hypothetical protein
VAPADRVTFGVQPAGRSGHDARPFFTYDVTPGATFDDHLSVENYSEKSITVTVYATDAVNTDNGGFGLISAGRKPTDAGAWISVTAPSARIRVPARAGAQGAPGEVVVPFRLRVPLTATPGDHVAGVLADLTTVSKDRNGQNVALHQRVAARVFVRVSGALHPGLTVKHLRVIYHDVLNPAAAGSATVRFTVVNSGNVKLGARPSLRVTGWFGTAADARGLAEIPLLFAGSSVQEVVTVHDVWPTMRIAAAVTLVPLRLEGDADGPLPARTTRSTTWAVPWALLVILALLVVLLVGRRRIAGLVRSRRTHARGARSASALPAVTAPASAAHADSSPPAFAQSPSGAPATAQRVASNLTAAEAARAAALAARPVRDPRTEGR